MNQLMASFHSWTVPLAVVTLLVGCEERNEFQPPPPPVVQVSTPLEQPIVDTIDFSGTTTAFARVELRARVQGYLQEIRFTDGADVEKGEVLFVIEPAPFETALRAAQAEVQRAEAALQLAQANLDRSTQLSRDRAVAESQLDLDRAELATAEANLAAAAASVDKAELDLSYTQVKAPISGRIGRHLLDEGNLVNSEQSMLAIIETLNPIYANFYLSESDLLRFMSMMRQAELPDPIENPPQLFMGLEGEQGFPHEGKLNFRELGIDPGTGTTLRRGLFDNANGQLVPGLFVRIRAPIGEPKPKLMVEERAIGTDQRGDFLLVVNAENIIEKRPIQLGVAVGNMRVIAEGIQKSDRVVVNALQRARPGATVDPQEVAMTVQIPPAHRGVMQPPTANDPGAANTANTEERANAGNTANSADAADADNVTQVESNEPSESSQ